ncbi:hypothetical protein DFH29DRAFT_872924 [Suillus ampliporus]|nr:hypothetical protein DFH29DRAFT_872924 [Suillus ampliporus]
MCRLLCDDLFTFRTELKKVIISITKRAYDIFLQGSTIAKEEVQKQGQFKNFTAQALRDACLEFYYSNSKKALKNTDEFHRRIPINCDASCSSGVEGLLSLAFGRPALTRTHFVNLQKSVDMLLDILERREELEEMLDQWARIGMGDFNEYAAGSVVGSNTEDINIIL